MNVTITPTPLKGRVMVPPSKSQTHRYIIAAALAEGESVIKNVAYSQDVEATIRCMAELGARFIREDSTLTVQGMAANSMSPMRRLAHPHLDCGESGSTLRFLIPVALALRGGAVFTGQGKLMERPLQPYFDLFDEKGISYELKDGVLTVSGLLTPGEDRLPGHVSSQFFTGLMFALPLLNGDSRIVITSPLESGSYVEMTRDAMRLAGVQSDKGNLPGNQTYKPFTATVEADWSQAAFFYAAHGLLNEVSMGGLNPFSNQGDSQIVHFYQELCGSDEETAQDVSQCPDLFPPLAVMAALRERCSTHIGGAARLRIKECDRINAVVEMLRKFGLAVEEFADGISLVGKSQLRGDVVIDSHNDHRIAMAAAIAATRATGPVTITNAECVAKSYPDFWEVYESLGGVIERT